MCYRPAAPDLSGHNFWATWIEWIDPESWLAVVDWWRIVTPMIALEKKSSSSPSASSASTPSPHQLQIQPHGALITLHPTTLAVHHASTSTTSVLGIPPQTLFTLPSFTSVLASDAAKSLRKALESGGGPGTEELGIIRIRPSSSSSSPSSDSTTTIAEIPNETTTPPAGPALSDTSSSSHPSDCGSSDASSTTSIPPPRRKVFCVLHKPKTKSGLVVVEFERVDAVSSRSGGRRRSDRSERSLGEAGRREVSLERVVEDVRKVREDLSETEVQES
ncbi:hypothetical protein HK104_000360, partial [Borealophlyctis nickersoniae]